MEIRLLMISFLAGITFACQNTPANDQKSASAESVAKEPSKREYYQAKMKEKDFALIPNGPCEDALDDTLHQRFVGYVETTQFADRSVSIEFKFKEECCQDFLGDYTISNDTLKFDFEPVNDVLCMCMCWYRYQLELNNLEEEFSVIDIKRKGTRRPPRLAKKYVENN